MCWNFFLLFLPSLSSPSSSLSLPPPPFLPHIFTPSLSLQEATVLRSSVSRNSGNPRLCLAHTHGQSILLLMNHLRSNKVKWRTENSVKVFCLSCYVSVQCAMTLSTECVCNSCVLCVRHIHSSLQRVNVLINHAASH